MKAIKRTERDSHGEIEVDANRLWGAQTERSRRNFKISYMKMPGEIISALTYIKKACAIANCKLGKLSKEKAEAVISACEDIIQDKYPDEFPLSVWQTGSGTQTNMNVNEVIAHIGAKEKLHPNDDVNMSQSSNDTFPSAICISGVIAVKKVMEACNALEASLNKLAEKSKGIIKIGRTHYQDAVPLYFSDEINAWRYDILKPVSMLEDAISHLSYLAIGGTAVGSGLNAPHNFDKEVCRVLSEELGHSFLPDENKFHALSSKDAVVFAHGALKALAANLFKIATDIRFLSSGPRCGIGELSIPENEPGSSIMPGKVNPTQCEALSMICVQVMGNDTAIGIAASQGHLELNVFMPLIAYNFLQSCNLLCDSIKSFTEKCVDGIRINRERVQSNLDNSLMLVTALKEVIGYEKAAEIAHHAHRNGITLRESALQLGLCDAQTFDKYVRADKMV